MLVDELLDVGLCATTGLAQVANDTVGHPVQNAGAFAL